MKHMKVKHKQIDMPDEYDKTIEQDNENDRWDNNLQAIKYTTQVHEKLKDELGTDLVMASLRPDQREFIINQVKHAFALEKQIPDKEVGQRIFITMIAEVLMTAILHRNVDNNTLVEIIGGVHNKEPDMIPGEEDTLMSRGVGKMKNIMGRGTSGPEQLEGR